MAVIGWGKPRVFIKDLDASAPKWEELPTPVEDSTQLTTTKGDKQEAKIEGGENEDVKYGKNTYALALNIRAAKGRKRPVSDSDGVVAIMLLLFNRKTQKFKVSAWRKRQFPLKTLLLLLTVVFGHTLLMR